MAVMVYGCHQVIAFHCQSPDVVWWPEIGTGLPDFPAIGGSFDTAVVGDAVVVFTKFYRGMGTTLKYRRNKEMMPVVNGTCFRKLPVVGSSCSMTFLLGIN